MRSIKHLALAVSALSALAGSALAQVPPRSVVLGIAPGASGAQACVTLQDGTGQAVQVGCLNPGQHAFTLSNNALSGTEPVDNATVLGRTVALRAQDHIDIKDAPYLAKGDAHQLTGCSIASGSTALSCGSPLTLADVGQTVWVRGAGPGGISLQATIASVQGGTATLSNQAQSASSSAIAVECSDDTAAFTSALSAARAVGRALYLPGAGYCLTSLSTTLPQDGVMITGDAPVGTGSDYTHNGSVILVSGKAAAPFAPGRGAKIKDVSFYWPMQDGSGTAPVVYPPLFESATIVNFGLDHVNIINAYRCLTSDAGGVAGDIKLDGVRAYCIDHDFTFMSAVPEVVQISDSMFSPHVYEDAAIFSNNKMLASYTGASGEFVHMDNGSETSPSMDGFSLTNSIVFGHRYGARALSGRFNLMGWTNVAWDADATILSLEGSSSAGLSWTGGYVTSLQWNGTTDDFPAVNLACLSETADILATGVNFAQANGSIFGESNYCGRKVQIVGGVLENWGLRGNPTQYYAVGNPVNTTEDLTVSGVGVLGATRGSAVPIGILSNSLHTVVVGDTFSGSMQAAVEPIGTTGTHLIAGNTSSGTTGGAALNDQTGSGATVIDASNVWDKSSNRAHVNMTASATFHGASLPGVSGGSGACGTGPAVAAGSSDSAGGVTVGTGANASGCPISFSELHTNAPQCSATDQTSGTNLVVTTSPTALVPRGTLGAGDRVTWSCGFFQ